VDAVGSVARFNTPYGVAVALDGSIYVADTNNHAIRRVEPWSKAVTTIAGTGTAGRSVGWVPTMSMFRLPQGVEVDAAGNVYVADTGNHAIRLLSGAWVAGSTTGAYGVGSGVGTSATFYSPVVVKADPVAGMLYVLDSPISYTTYGSSTTTSWTDTSVRAIVTASRAVTTFTTMSGSITALALNATGRAMFVKLDTTIRTYTYTGASSVLAGHSYNSGYADGTKTAALFNPAYGMVLDPDANVVYVADSNNNRIRRVTVAGVVTTVAGSSTAGLLDGTGTAARFLYPYGITISASGMLYVADRNNHAIRQVQVRPPAVAAALPAPLPPSPLAAGDQLTAWRALLAVVRNAAVMPPLACVDATGVSFAAPLVAANTAGMNPAIATLLLGSVTLAARNASLAGTTTNTNATFSTSAQRGLSVLVLQTQSIPADSLALPVLASLTVSPPPLPGQPLVLAARSFAGLPAVTCINCGGVSGLVNLTGAIGGGSAVPLAIAPLLTLPAITSLDLSGGTLTTAAAQQLNGAPYLTWLSLARNAISAGPFAFPSLTYLDLRGNGLNAVAEHDFDGVPGLRWLSLAVNNISFIHDAAFSDTKHAALATIVDDGNPLLDNMGCRVTGVYRAMTGLLAGGSIASCSPCTPGYACPGGTTCTPGRTACQPGGRPSVPCPATSYALAGAAACTACTPGTATLSTSLRCTPCAATTGAPSCNATASWRDTLTVVAEGAGGWGPNASILVVSAAASRPSDGNVSCGSLTILSQSAVTCTLAFLPAAVAATAPAPYAAQLWVAIGGVTQRLNVSVAVMSPAPVTVASGGGTNIAPRVAGGRVVLRLPAARLTAADWDASFLPRPPVAQINDVTVWLGGALCTAPVWESTTTLSCAVPALDGADTSVIVQLSRAFNVTGLLTSLYSPPVLAPSTTVQLLPPLSAAPAGAVNITLAGTGLCAGSLPRLTSVAVSGVPCAGGLVCTGGAATCVGWNATAAAAGGVPLASATTLTLNVTALWVTTPVACAGCVTVATRPVLTTVTPTTIAAAGVPIVVSGAGFMGGGAAVLPTVLMGGEVCGAVVLLGPQVVQCTAPVLLASAPGFPAVRVVVVNAAGAASTEVMTVSYPVSFAVSWAATPAVVALPGGTLAPPPALSVLSRDAATCTLSINASACANYNAAALASRPAGMTITAPPSSLVVGASGTADAVTNILNLTALVASGASACTGTLVASCIDDVGLTATTAGQPSPSLTFASWHAGWTSSVVLSAVVPEALPAFDAAVTVLFPSGGAAAVDLGAAAPAALACLALLLPASVTAPPLGTPLERVSVRDVLSSVSGSLGVLNATSVAVRFDGLSAAAARLGQALVIVAECAWTPSGERVRLPSIPVDVASAALAITTPAAVLVEAYEPVVVVAVASLLPSGVATFGGANGTCTWRVTATSLPSLVLSAATSATTWVVASDGSVVSAAGAPLALTLEGPPGGTMTLQLACSVWGANTIASAQLALTTRDYVVVLRGGLGTSRAVWPSGVQSVLPWAASVDVAAPARGVLTCGVEVTGVTLPPATHIPGVGLGLADTAVQLVGEPSVSVLLTTSATRANASLPYVGLRAPGGTNASLVLTCRDGVGRSATLGAAINVSVAALSAVWSGGTVASMPSVVVPTQALPSLTLTLASTPAVPLPPNTDVSSLVTCVAALVRASMALPLGTPLATMLAAAPP